MTSEHNSMVPELGVSIEYMIVDRSTLELKPIISNLLESLNQEDKHNPAGKPLKWKPGYQPHIFRICSASPQVNLNTLEHAIADELRIINRILAEFGAMLLPGGMHPFADPFSIKTAQPADAYSELTQRIFDGKGHSWVNLNRSYVELPYHDEHMLQRLQVAIRIVLPIIPALSAASPIVEGNFSGRIDNGIRYARARYSRFPAIAGQLVPEPYFSERKYREMILDKIKAQLSPVDPEGLIHPNQINFRGAVPDFDGKRMILQIMEPQECLAADMAIIKLVQEAIRFFMDEKTIGFEEQSEARMEILAGILEDVAENGRHAEVFSSEYLAFFGLDEVSTVGTIWKHLFQRLANDPLRPLAMYEKELSVILDQGPLAERILTVVGEKPGQEELMFMWRRLGDCLEQNRLLIL
ncbi:MAG: glutamate-cysteine ligase family protein [Cyclobacteriaceae bacterium]